MNFLLFWAAPTRAPLGRPIAESILYRRADPTYEWSEIGRVLIDDEQEFRLFDESPGTHYFALAHVDSAETVGPLAFAEITVEFDAPPEPTGFDVIIEE